MVELPSYEIARIDFYADWIEHLRGELVKMGYSVNAKATNEEIWTQYFNVQHRRIPEVTRKVLVSREFQCPLNLKAGLEFFRKKIENGEDLNPHVSRKIKNANFSDMMLNDWGIQHFHLGTRVIAKGKSKGLIEGTEPVLFACVAANTIYFIDVKGHNDFEDKDIVEIVHNNWPDLLGFRSPSGRKLATQSTSKDILEMRNARIITAFDLTDGTVYTAPGGGYTGSGISAIAIHNHDGNARTLEYYEDSIKDKIQEIGTRIREMTSYEDNALAFQLLVIDGNFVAHELNSDVSLVLAPLFYVTV
jgi:hypothetical protein